MLKEKFEIFLEKNLNPSQLNAVKQKDGPILVVAGAGSGKTRVITSRITNLILNEEVSPDSIIALTFTNKAAQEMKDRINSWLPFDSRLPFLGTFHSFCLKILKVNNNLLEIPIFSILDDSDQLKMIQTIIQKFSLNKRVNARQIQYNISYMKNRLALDQSDLFSENKLSQEIFLEYEQERKASKYFDFDDLIIEMVKLFKKNKDLKKRFQTQIRHVLVDEYQDTSLIQHELLKEISFNENAEFTLNSLCVVGDEDQSIYSWRGATVDNIVHFNKDFSKTKMIKIEQNYRSVEPILEIANKIIGNNKNRNPKRLWSEKKANNRAIYVMCTSDYKEGEMIAHAIKSIEKNKSLNSVAVLYRTHFQSRTIEEALIKNSIPYQIIGGIQFYERKEIKDIVAYLKLSINPFDKVSFFRVINCPARKLGEKFEEEFYKCWTDEPFLTFYEVAQKLIDEEKLTRVKEASLLNFVQLIQKIKEVSLIEAINHIIVDTSYIAFLKDNFERDEAVSKIENVKEFVRAAQFFQEQRNEGISVFLEEIALMQQKIKEQDENDNKVQMMTLHAAKGLEFDIVFIPGVEEGMMPSKKSELDNNIEEERRLFYVGITRAKEHLILSSVKYRNSFGQTNVQAPSRFLKEIPSSLIYREDSSVYFNEIQFLSLFDEFFVNKTNPVDKVSVSNSSWSDIKPAKKSPKLATEKSGNFQEKQSVKHVFFGIGTIQKVETRTNGKTVVTIKFQNDGIKKVDSQFLQQV